MGPTRQAEVEVPDVVVVVEPDDVDVDVDVDTPVAVVVVPVLPVSLWPRPEPLREHPPKSHKAAKKTWRVCMLCPKKKKRRTRKKTRDRRLITGCPGFVKRT